jgi:FtsP/CotA-like multicopper oxidase with cupredoxin domain
MTQLSQDTNCRIDGLEREVYLINGQQPGPLVDVDEGDDVEIFVQNDLSVETTIHWHG